MSPCLAPLLLAVPLYDTATVLWIRRREGRPLYVGDRRHVTHRLLQRGAGVWRAVMTLNLWTLAAAAVALFLHHRGSWELPALLPMRPVCHTPPSPLPSPFWVCQPQPPSVL